MASNTKATTVRFDENDKKEATEILDSIGLSFAAYLNIAVKQLILKRKVPFSLDAPGDIPNEETMKAIVEAEAKAYGIIDDDSRSFDNAKDAIAYLESVE